MEKLANRKITKEKQIEMAKQMRSRDRFGPVTDEEFSEFPVKESKLTVKTSVGKSDLYLLEHVKETEGLKPVLINFHGGGFIKGRLDRDKLFCSKLVHELECIVVDVDYKLAPENTYPVALYESYDVVKWVYDHAHEFNGNSMRIGLVGHSAGGNLVAGALALSALKNSPMVKCMAIEYSPLDLATDPEEKRRPKKDMPAEKARLYNAFYCKPEQMGDYYVSPIFTPEVVLATYPKSLIIYAGQDSLADENELFSVKLSQVGVDVTTRKFEHSRHGFTINRMDEHKESFDLFSSFLKESL